jgi:transcriptional regulator GlxA family with amidase domain
VRARLVELLLVEAMRATPPEQAPPGLLRGLGDSRLAVALEQMHAGVDQPWTVERLARAAALSRSSFYERFTRAVGLAPMEYLLAWRMEIARELLREGRLKAAEIAERVGYGSGSAFSVAFARHIGQTPTAYARASRAAA